jgi:hypothetical protein
MNPEVVTAVVLDLERALVKVSEGHDPAVGLAEPVSLLSPVDLSFEEVSVAATSVIVPSAPPRSLGSPHKRLLRDAIEALPVDADVRASLLRGLGKMPDEEAARLWPRLDEALRELDELISDPKPGRRD